jgi:hypothetical protein
MDLVGYLKSESVCDIEQAIRKAKTFKHTRTDTYEECRNFTPRELEAELKARKGAIKKTFLKVFAPQGAKWYGMLELHQVRSGVLFIDKRGLPIIEQQAIEDVFQKLVESGDMLVTVGKESAGVYRTASNKNRRPSPSRSISV